MQSRMKVFALALCMACLCLTTTGCEIDAQTVSAILDIAGGLMQQVGQSGVLDQNGAGNATNFTGTNTGSLVGTTGGAFDLPVTDDPQATVQPQDQPTELAAVTPASEPVIDNGQ